MRVVLTCFACLLAALVSGGCERTKPLPGLSVDEEGRIVRADAGSARTRIERRVAATLDGELPGARHTVTIRPEPTENPRYRDRRTWQWHAITVVVTVTTGEAAAPDRLRRVVVAALDDHLTDPDLLKLEIETPDATGEAPAVSD